MAALPAHNNCDNSEEFVETDDLLNALNSVEDLIYRLDSLNDPDCVEGISLRLDVLKRYLVNIRINDSILQLVDSAYRRVNQFEERYSALSDNTASCPSKIYTGKRGKPSFDIKEEQVSFLLEQGFNVGEMSKMLGVSKRTLERRMQTFGMSVTGMAFHNSYTWCSKKKPFK